jgi:hypothetical protein
MRVEREEKREKIFQCYRYLNCDNYQNAFNLQNKLEKDNTSQTSTTTHHHHMACGVVMYAIPMLIIDSSLTS